MIDDYKPIFIKAPKEFENIEIYFAHDIHKGSEQHDTRKWKAFVDDILAQENRYVAFAGDCFENAIVGSKSDIYTQVVPPYEQKEWTTEQFSLLRDRIIAIVPGNHCNRTTKTVGLFPLYDCALAAGVDDKYRQHFAFVDLAVGDNNHRNKGNQHRYVGYITHKMRDNKTYNSSDFIDGIDFAAYGHDHDAKDHARSKLVYNRVRGTISQRNIEVIDSGAFLTYGGYGVEAAYRPLNSKCYKLILDGKQNAIQTVGFYV